MPPAVNIPTARPGRDDDGAADDAGGDRVQCRGSEAAGDEQQQRDHGGAGGADQTQ
jgi:hypothetical protein